MKNKSKMKSPWPAYIAWGLLSILLGMQCVSAQYTGAKPYASKFGYAQQNEDDGEFRFNNESEYDLVVAIVNNGGTVVDHAYISKYRTHTFTGLKAGSYTYKAEIRDGGNAFEYVKSKTRSDIATNKCPEGYTCSGRSWSSITFFFSVTTTTGTNQRTSPRASSLIKLIAL